MPEPFQVSIFLHLTDELLKERNSAVWGYNYTFSLTYLLGNAPFSSPGLRALFTSVPVLTCDYYSMSNVASVPASLLNGV